MNEIFFTFLVWCGYFLLLGAVSPEEIDYAGSMAELIVSVLTVISIIFAFFEFLKRKDNESKWVWRDRMEQFLKETEYIDYNNDLIRKKRKELFSDNMTDVTKAETAYLFVRDRIAHSFDCNAKAITAKASDVLKNGTGICHAKANLLAALLRSQNIPAGFCFEHIILGKDDSMGYCVHGFNAVYLEGHWIKLDARGNKKGVNGQFSLNKPILAYPPREEYDEYFFKGIYANPHKETMEMLEKAKCLNDILNNIPEFVTGEPDIME